MDLFETYKKSTLETALNEFGEKYHAFCNDHTCTSCPLASAVTSPICWRQQCKANVIDHLTEANKKMDEAIAKAEEAKRKKDEYAKNLMSAIKGMKCDLEFHNMRDADYVILNPDDYDLLKGNTTICLTYSLSGISHAEIYGMRIVCDNSVRRGEFVIGFKTDSHIKEVSE